MGCYLPTYDASTVENIVLYFVQHPHGTALLVAIYFKVYLDVPEGTLRKDDTTSMMETVGIKDMATYFLPRRKSWARYGRTW